MCKKSVQCKISALWHPLPPLHCGYFRGSGAITGFCPLKMHLSCVSWWEWTKWKYSANLFIYKHCIKCSLHWFILISIYNYFPVHGSCNRAIYLDVVFIKDSYFTRKTYFIAKIQESTDIFPGIAKVLVP